MQKWTSALAVQQSWQGFCHAKTVIFFGGRGCGYLWDFLRIFVDVLRVKSGVFSHLRSPIWTNGAMSYIWEEKTLRTWQKIELISSSWYHLIVLFEVVEVPHWNRFLLSFLHHACTRGNALHWPNDSCHHQLKAGLSMALYYRWTPWPLWPWPQHLASLITPRFSASEAVFIHSGIKQWYLSCLSHRISRTKRRQESTLTNKINKKAWFHYPSLTIKHFGKNQVLAKGISKNNCSIAFSYIFQETWWTLVF